MRLELLPLRVVTRLPSGHHWQNSDRQLFDISYERQFDFNGIRENNYQFKLQECNPKIFSDFDNKKAFHIMAYGKLTTMKTIEPNHIDRLERLLF